MEELINFFFGYFKPDIIDNSYYYCFYSKIDDGEDDEDSWEGTVGQLKITIEEQSNILEGKIN